VDISFVLEFRIASAREDEGEARIWVYFNGKMM